MTINPASTNEFSISSVIQMAYRLAGLMTPNESLSSPDWSARASMAAEFLDTITKALQPGALIARHVVFSTVPVVAGTASYSLGASVLSYVGNGMFKETGEDTETPVAPIDRETYQNLSDKTIEGIPTMYYLHRVATTQVLYLFPVPSLTGTLTMQAHQLVADSTITSYTPDLERHWTMWLVYELSHLLAMANSLPIPECSRLRGLAEIEHQKCKGYSKQTVPVTVRMGHGTGWGR